MKLAPILAGLAAGILILAGIRYFERPEPESPPIAPPAPRSAPVQPAEVPPAPVVRKRAEQHEISKPIPPMAPPSTAEPAPPAPQPAPPASQPAPPPPQPDTVLPAVTRPAQPPKTVLRPLETPRIPLTADEPPPRERPERRPELHRSNPGGNSTSSETSRSTYNGPSSGTLKYDGPPVIQNGEVVFRGLPDTRLNLAYDRDAWEARLSPDGDGYQKLVLRSLKPGSQRKCEVKWHVYPN